MINAKIIIGANFGDEGKGLLTDYYVRESHKEGRKSIVVCFNGGSQRGHTVTLNNGVSHVFHHFGSGTLSGADTFLSSDFIVNPMIFMKEAKDLLPYVNLISNPISISCDCRLTLPYDMLINQFVERQRADSKHGSCGVGIFETVKRNEGEYAISVGTFKSLNFNEKLEFLRTVRTNYVPRRVSNLCSSKLDSEFYDIIDNDNVMFNFIDDFECMLSLSKPIHEYDLHDYDLLQYDSIIFEGGQGLLLDMDNTEYMPHLTPSKTGVSTPAKIINRLRESEEIDVDCCYVTRSYVTRHGAGKLNNECDKSDINSEMFDSTNIPNDFQDTLRYAKLDLESLVDNVSKDFLQAPIDSKLVIAVTHLNETNNSIIGVLRNERINSFDFTQNVSYLTSDSKLADDIKTL